MSTLFVPTPFAPRRAALLCAAAVTVSLTGCVLDSPYWAQTFASTTTTIPIQTWTTDKTRVVKIECSKSYHGGLYPFGGPEVWTLVTNLTPSTNASYDPKAGVVYSAGTALTLPAACWHADGAYSPPLYMTSLRATQLTASGNTQSYFVFDATGLECLGREVGKGTSWFSWIGKSCHMTYSGSSTMLPYVRIIANNLGAAAASSGTTMMSKAAPVDSMKARLAAEPNTMDLSQRLAVEAMDYGWAPMMEARLRAGFDNAMPEGTQLMEGTCRSTMCRVEVTHRDADAQLKFVAALAPLGLFSNDGQRGVMQQSDDGTGLRATYFIAREGHRLAAAATTR